MPRLYKQIWQDLFLKIKGLTLIHFKKDLKRISFQTIITIIHMHNFLRIKAKTRIKPIEMEILDRMIMEHIKSVRKQGYSATICFF